MEPQPVVRPLRLSDLPGLMDLVRAARWNQTQDDWRHILELEPEGAIGLEIGGRLACSATAICYGRDLAWIGMVLTLPEYRGRGFARRLMLAALDFIERRGVAWTKLDATDMGHHLYETLGFRDEQTVERWRREPFAGGEFVEAALGSELDAELDRAAFGADRSRLLDFFRRFEAASVAGGGFAMGRPGNAAAYFGPCVCRRPEVARVLLEWFLARHAQEPVYWDLLPANREAARMAEEYGFEKQRILARMARPSPGVSAPLEKHDALVFGLAGFEFG
ncbi:MAG: GNAT family N-acetyltransferase [Acidobacteria bacterium]|nr:GNAT family N-acetyltransferase [Acidobacteriota bacterium]